MVGRAGRLARMVLGVAVVAIGTSSEAALREWHAVPGPTPGPARAVGSYDRGCLAGAAALPLEGPGFQVARPERARHYGHPRLIAFVSWLAARVTASGAAGLLVADLSQPRGGPMPSGHASHQLGLDVDLWFRVPPPLPLAPEERAALPPLSVVAAGGEAVNENWGPAQVSVLRLAAGHPEVARIFVHPAIKRELCRTVEGDREWLARVRPWWGHDAHFHVRLRCLPDDGGCQDQPASPGEGCGDSLAWWFTEEAAARLAAAKAGPRRPLLLDDLPRECREVLASP